MKLHGLGSKSEADEDHAALEVEASEAASPDYQVTLGYRLLNLGVFGGAVMANLAGLFGWYPGGQTLQDLRDKYSTPITPHRYAFYMWALVYALQAVAVLDLFVLTRHGLITGKKAKVLRAIDTFWVMGWICEGAWVIAFQAQTSTALWVAFGLMCGATACFGMALLRLQIRFRSWQNPWYYILYLASSSIATAWLSVMTALSAMAVTSSYSPPQALLQALSYVCLAAVTALGILATWFGRDLLYGLVMAGALLAICVGNDDVTVTIVVASILLALTAAAVVVTLVAILWLDRHRARHQKLGQDEEEGDDGADDMSESTHTAPASAWGNPASAADAGPTSAWGVESGPVTKFKT